MKKGFLFFTIMMICAAIASAQEIETANDAETGNGLIIAPAGGELTVEEASALTEETVEEPQTTPESPLYGLRNTFKEIGMFFTFNTEKKVEKRLDLAEQKLLQVNKMLEKGNLQAALQAQKAYQKEVEKARNRLIKLEQKTTKMQLKTMIKFQNLTEAHQELIERIRANMEIRIQEMANLSEEQQQRIEELISALEEIRNTVSNETRNRRKQAEDVYREEVGNETFEEEIDEIEEERGLKKARKARITAALARTEKKLIRAKIALKKIESAELKKQLIEARNLIARLRNQTDEKLNATDYEDVEKERREINNFGQNISALAKQLRIAKQAGNFTEAHAALVEATKLNREQVLNRVRAKIEEKEREQNRTIKAAAVKTGILEKWQTKTNGSTTTS